MLALNEKLIAAITHHQVEDVRQCLQQGADPNCIIEDDLFKENPKAQPNTPLKLVMFRISDSLLEEEGLRDFKEIASLLLEHGADPKPAQLLAELRYGPYDPNADATPFMDVWSMIMKD